MYSKVEAIHIEVTSLCNLACPQCPRIDQKGRLQAEIALKHLTLEQIRKFFPKKVAKNFREVFACGNFGDPAANPHLIEIFKYFREVAPDAYLHIHTNGSLQSPGWWRKLHHAIGEHGSVQFAIDGLKNTNPIYRRNSDFGKIMENATAYIEEGGYAKWGFIVFEHNEHQVEEARELSREKGFQEFKVRKTDRFFSPSDGKFLDSLVLPGSTQEIFPPKSKPFRHKRYDSYEKIIEKEGTFLNYLNKTKITCSELKINRVYVDYTGKVFPCCFIGENYALQSSKNLLNWTFATSDWAKVLNADEIDLNLTSLGKAVNSASFARIKEGWARESLKEGKHGVCALQCGDCF